MSHVFLLFGASRGIGAACARELANRGAQVSLAARDKQGVKKVADTIGKLAISHQVDIADSAQVKKAVDATIKSFGRIDTVINFAAFTGVLDKPVWDIDADDWQASLSANTTGPFNIIQHVLPVLQEQGRGALFFASSPFGDNPQANMGAYGASRAGSHALIQQLAAELHGSEIGAAIIYPGMTDTKGLTDFRKARGGPQQSLQLQSPEVMANLFVWAAMQTPWDINGAVLSWSDPQIQAEMSEMA